MSKQNEEEKLSTDELKEVAGGIGEAEGLADGSTLRCPICGSTNISRDCIFYSNGETANQYTCNKCGYVWGNQMFKAMEPQDQPVRR